MERRTRPAGTDADTILALLGGCNSETDGVELAYQALDLVVAHYHLSEAQLVLRPGPLAPQIFVQGRRHVTPDLVEILARKPSGLYASPDVVPLTVQDALTGCCEMALAAHVARHQAGREAGGLAARHVMEDAVRRWASRSARFRWRFTLVLLGSTGPGPADARWRALAGAVQSAGRICDEAGVAGPGHAAAILADAGPDDVDTYVARLGDALAGGTGGQVGLVAGSATAPADSVDPDQLWRLCEQRLVEASPAGAPPPRAGSGAGRRQRAASEVELELRCLPDVVSVGMAGLIGPEGRVERVTAVTRRRNDAVRREAAELAAEHLGDVPLAVLDGSTRSVAPAPGTPNGGDPGSPSGGSGGSGGSGADRRSRLEAHDLEAHDLAAGVPPALEGEPRTEPQPNGRAGQGANGHANGHTSGRPADGPVGRPTGAAGATVVEAADAARRVVLLTGTFDGTTGVAEVTVAWQGETAVGRATGSPLAGAAQATLSAVEALGLAVPYLLTSVERATTEPGAPVVASLAALEGAGNGTGRRRFGVAEGDDDVEAASRATLSALNRLLALATGSR